MKTAIIMFQMIEILKRLIAAKSTLEVGEIEAAKVAAEAAEKWGLEARIENWNTNRANVLVKLASQGKRPGILFLTHLDVVGADKRSWHTPPFEGIEKEGRVYGRGSVDMKGGIAAAIEAMGRLAETGTKIKGDVYLAGVGGEETDSAGIERFVSNISSLGKLGGIIICEPTGLKVVTCHRGMIWVKVTTHGKSAHGSMPHIGINAIESMLAVLDHVRKMDTGPGRHPKLGTGTISINRINAGTATNIIPDSCSAEIDVRVVPGQSTGSVFDSFRLMIDQMSEKDPKFRAELAVLKRAEALETDDSCEFVELVCKATGIAERSSVGFTTDGPWLKPLGVPIVVLGPGDPELCHRPDEYIEVADLEKAADFYQKIISRYLG